METALAIKSEQPTTDGTTVISIEDVKKFIAPNATDKELFMFIGIAKSYGLNPFKREIHFVKYGNTPGQVIVGYESYLKRAEDTGLLNGWSVRILDKDAKTERAEITIHRKDRQHPFVWEVQRSEFDKQQSVWKQIPQFMLKKVAIAQGFRLAFPKEIGGMPYIPEEINGKTSEELPAVEQVSADKPKKSKTMKELKSELAVLMKAKGLSKESQAAFYAHVNPQDEAGVQEFIDNFDDHLQKFMEHDTKPDPTPITCPDGEETTTAACDGCLKRSGCPSHD